jgi:hypothetical protein
MSLFLEENIMGGYVVRNISNALTTFVGRVLGLENGNFTLTTGSHQVQIPITINNPTSVWVKFKSNGYDGCGQAVINKLGYELINGAILFDADVKTESCLIEWFAVN